MKTAVIYSRVSSSGYQSNRQDTSRQVEDLIKYADFANMDVKKIFEEHVSGAKKQKPVLDEAIEFCKQGHIDTLLVSELSRVGRNAFEVLATVKDLVDNGINLYMQKEQLNLLDEDGKPTMFAPIMIATLSTCAELERENIKFRLQSGRQKYPRATKGITLQKMLYSFAAHHGCEFQFCHPKDSAAKIIELLGGNDAEKS